MKYNAKKAIVSIWDGDVNQANYLGCGVCVTTNKILTAYHVVETKRHKDLFVGLIPERDNGIMICNIDQIKHDKGFDLDLCCIELKVDHNKDILNSKNYNSEITIIGYDSDNKTVYQPNPYQDVVEESRNCYMEIKTDVIKLGMSGGAILLNNELIGIVHAILTKSKSSLFIPLKNFQDSLSKILQPSSDDIKVIEESIKTYYLENLGNNINYDDLKLQEKIIHNLNIDDEKEIRNYIKNIFPDIIVLLENESKSIEHYLDIFDQKYLNNYTTEKDNRFDYNSDKELKLIIKEYDLSDEKISKYLRGKCISIIQSELDESDFIYAFFVKDIENNSIITPNYDDSTTRKNGNDNHIIYNKNNLLNINIDDVVTKDIRFFPKEGDFFWKKSDIVYYVYSAIEYTKKQYVFVMNPNLNLLNEQKNYKIINNLKIIRKYLDIFNERTTLNH